MIDLFSENDHAWHLREIKAPDAWQTANSRGAGIRIGHIDTGYATHVELEAGALDIGASYDVLKDQPDARDPLAAAVHPTDIPGHGTYTASVLISRGGVAPAPAPGASAGGAGDQNAADQMNEGVLTGVAPEATLVPFRATRSVVLIQSDEVSRAIYRAVRANCHVISISLGGLPTTFLHEALKFAIGHDVIVVAAGGQVWRLVPFPGEFPECIAVAATGDNHEPWGWSARGPGITVSAPGADVWVADPVRSTTKVFRGSGTSFATPCVAGTAALWLAKHGRDALISRYAGKNRLQNVFREIIERTAQQPDPDTWDKGMGAGILDADEVIRRDLPDNLPPDTEYAADTVAAWVTGLFSQAQKSAALSTLSFMFTPAGGNLATPLSPDAERKLNDLLEQYGVELLHLLMRRPAAFELLRTAVNRVADGRPEQAVELVLGALRMLLAIASTTLSGLLHSPG